MGTRISSLGVALPDLELSSESMEEELGLERGWIEERTGIASRRVAAGSDSVVSLATSAALDACANADVDLATLDVVLVATCTADELLPPVAPRVATAIGAPGIGAVDVGAACAGALWGLVHADALIASGAARRVLVVGSEILSRMITGSDPRTAVLFGDGAGAILVEATQTADRIGPFHVASDGTRPEFLWTPHDDRSIRMRGLEVYKRAVEEMTSSARRAIKDAGSSVDEVDLVVAHQANARILTAVAERLGLPAERMYSNIDRYGNTSAASIPIALYDAVSEGRLHPGDRVLLVTFGAGFIWGAGLVTWAAGVGCPQPEREVVHAGT